MATNYEIGQTFTPDDLRDMALQVADHYEVPKDLFLGLNAHESSWNPAAKNPRSSARGLGQFIDGTAKNYFDEPITNDENDPRNHPGKSLDASARYLKDLYVQYGDWQQAVLHYGENTPAYLNKIKAAAGREADEHDHFKQGQFMDVAGGVDLGVGVSPAYQDTRRKPDPLGHLVLPVSGVIAGGFGDERNGGARAHMGIDYAAPAGTPIVAPADLEYIQGGVGGTNLRPNDRWAHYRVAGTDYEYRIAHQGELPKPGTVFKQGETMGTVGGVIDNPHLHAGFFNTKTQKYEDVGQKFGLARDQQIQAGIKYSEINQQSDFMNVAGGADLGFGMSPVGQEAQPGALYQGFREYLGLNKEPWKMSPVLSMIAADYMKTPATYPGMTQEEQEAADLAGSIGGAAPLGLSGEDLLFPGQRQKDVVESEAQRVMGRFVDGYTASLTEGAKKAAFGDTFMPETALGSAIGQGAYLAGQIMGPFKLLKMLTGNYLLPTVEGLRGTALILTQGLHGAVNLGALQGLSQVIPAMIAHPQLADAAWDVMHSAGIGALVGQTFPMLAKIPGQGVTGTVARMGVGFAAMDYLRAAPGKWSTLGDFSRAFQTWDEDSKKQFASLSYQYIMDLYFANTVKPYRQQIAEMGQHEIFQMMSKLSIPELEQTILGISGRETPATMAVEALKREQNPPQTQTVETPQVVKDINPDVVPSFEGPQTAESKGFKPSPEWQALDEGLTYPPGGEYRQGASGENQGRWPSLAAAGEAKAEVQPVGPGEPGTQPTAAGEVEFKGFRTEGLKGNFFQRGHGTYIALDEPFQPDQGTVKKVSISIAPRKIWDPNGLIEGTDVEQSKADLEPLINRLNDEEYQRRLAGQAGKELSTPDRKQFGKDRTRILKDMGYEAEVGWIDGPEGGNRELVVFDKTKVKGEAGTQPAGMAAPEGPQAGSKGNPYAAKANAAREKYNRLIAPTEHEMAMAEAFPVGGGYGRKGGETRIESSVKKAGEAQDVLKEAQRFENMAAAFDAGKIDDRGMPISKNREERQDQKANREERIQEAKKQREGREIWEIPSDIYADSSGYFAGSSRELVKYEHEQTVEKALIAGKPVPPEVLAEYPDLAAKYAEGPQAGTPAPLEKMYSGGPDTATLLSQLRENVAGAKEGWQAVKDNIRETVAPASLLKGEQRTVGQALITMMGRKEEAIKQAGYALMDFRKLFERMSETENYKMATVWQRGEKTGSDLDRAYELIHEINEALVPKISEYKDLPYQENYLRQAYKKPTAAILENQGRFRGGDAFKNFFDLNEAGNPRIYRATFDENGGYEIEKIGEGLGGKPTEPEVSGDGYGYSRTLTGGRSYFQAKKVPDWATAMMLGFKPKFPNLMDLWMFDIREKNQFIWGNALMKWAYEHDYLKVTLSTKMPFDWQEVKDPTQRISFTKLMEIHEAKPFESMPGDYDMTAPGKYKIGNANYVMAAPKDAARIFNNWLLPGLRGNAVYDLYRDVVDPVRRIGVAFSTFHLRFTMNNSLATGTGQALSKVMGALIAGDMEGVAKAVKSGVLNLTGKQFLSQLSEGKALAEALYTGSEDPILKGTLRRFIDTGGTLPPPESMRPIFKSMAEATWEGLVNLNPYGGWHPFKGIGKFIEAGTEPIMTHAVPFAKLGGFVVLDRALSEKLDAKYEKLAEASPQKAQELAAQQATEYTNGLFEINKHLDNIYGQMNYDALLINNTVKDLLFFVIKYPGWNIGSGRWMWAMAGGLKHTLTRGQQASVGEQEAMWMGLGLVVNMGIYNSLMYWFINGEAPPSIPELFTKGIWTGGYTRGGNKEYIRDASYWRDLWGMTPINQQGKPDLGKPFQTMGAKAQDIFRIPLEIFGNKEYYSGNQIRDPEHPADWPGQVGNYLGKQVVPYSFRGMYQGISPWAKYGSFGGFTPTPARLTDTPALQELRSYREAETKTMVTIQKQGQREVKRNLMDFAYEGDGQGFIQALRQARAAGEVTASQYKNLVQDGHEIISDPHYGPLRVTFRKLTDLGEAIKVYGLATPDEREALRPVMMTKWAGAQPESRRKYRQEFMELKAKMESGQ